MEILKLDERFKVSSFFVNNYESLADNLADVVMQDLLECNPDDADIRDVVMKNIKQNGNHLVYSAKDRNIHYLVKCA